MAKRHVGLLLVVLAAGLMGLLGARDALAITFTPTYVPAVVSPVAGANTDTTVNFTLAPGSANFSAVIGFLPAAFGVGTCPANSGAGGSLTQVCADGSIPNGAILGKVAAAATLGLVNSGCTNAVSPTWDMMDATTNMAVTVEFEDDPVDVDTQGEEFEDSLDDPATIGINEAGDGIPNGAQMYPEYLTRIIHGPQVWDVMDPGSAPLQPMLRSYGKTVIANTDVSLQFLLFPPGIVINTLPIPATSGYSLITVLQNTGDPGAISTPGQITDSCSPVNSLATTYGITRDNPASAAVDEGGFVVLTAPAAGAYEAHALLLSNRDEDGDNIENQLDPCSTQGNAGGWSPFVAAPAGDVDQDGLPGVCDPNDDPLLGGANNDQDGDGFLNRGDNCPLAADTPGPTAQDDVDRDGIGNLCDPAPTTPSPGLVFYPGYPNTNICPPVPAPAGTTCLTVTGPIMGDTNCSTGNPNSIDALQTLRFSASLEPYGACVNIAGDNDCNGSKNSIDALRILRYSASLPNGVPPVPCTLIGAPIP